MARSFAALQYFRNLASLYLALRAARPEIPARSVHAWLTCDDPGLAQNIDQFLCRHEWPRDLQERDRCLCVHCGLDGDG